MPGHSSIITMSLRTDNREFDVVQSGLDHLLIDEPATFPAGEAVFSITIDGETSESTTWVEAVENSTKVYAIAKSAPASLKVAES